MSMVRMRACLERPADEDSGCRSSDTRLERTCGPAVFGRRRRTTMGPRAGQPSLRRPWTAPLRGTPMDAEGFRAMLRARRLEPDQIERSVAMVRRFEEFLQ